MQKYYNQKSTYLRIVTKRYQSPITYRLREIPIKQIKVWKDVQVRKLDRDEKIKALSILEKIAQESEFVTTAFSAEGLFTLLQRDSALIAPGAFAGTFD